MSVAGYFLGLGIFQGIGMGGCLFSYLVSCMTVRFAKYSNR